MKRDPSIRTPWKALLVIAAAGLLFRPAPTRASASGGLVPSGLKCEYRTEPLGIDSLAPRLSWIVESSLRGQAQSAYQVLTADSLQALASDTGNLWDSGKVPSGETLNIVYRGKSLRSGQRCFWKIRVWDMGGATSPWSAPSSWEMALLSPADWKGRWIGDGRPTPARDEDFFKDDPAPLFRKEFTLPADVRGARLYITGLGYYEAGLNGRRVGDQVLDPGWTNYSKRVFYSAYDVTGLLRKGANCLGVMLGNGWYNPLPLLMWGNRNIRESLPVGRPCFIAQLDIELADGSRLSVATEVSWKSHPGPVLRNNVYLGEVYDARKEVRGWDRPGLDESSWLPAVPVPGPGGALQAQPQPPIRVTAVMAPVKITRPEPGTFIADFGRNFAGLVRLRVKAPAGTIIRLRYGELLYPDGRLNPMTGVCGQIKGKKANGDNIGGPGSPEVAWQSDTYIADGGGEEVYAPRFTFRGFRYAEVTGCPGVLDPASIEGLSLNSDVGPAGSFSCSNEIFNRIQEMVRRTFLSNIFSVQSDCPHREKFGYGGDIAATSEAFIDNFDMAGFYAKTVRDWGDAARPDGMLTDTAPFVGIQYCGVGWAMAHPLLLEQLYRYYGDRRLLEEQYATSAAWLDLVSAQNPEGIIKEGLSDHEGLEEAPAPQMATPFYFRSARLMSRLAAVLGKTGDAARYERLADGIRTAYLRRFLTPGTGTFNPTTQAGQAFALYTGLVPPGEKDAALSVLLKKMKEDGRGRLSTGIFGTKFMLDVLSGSGHADAAYGIVGRRTFPGWGYMLDNGATTLWEHWEGSDDTFSHNHPMFGSVSDWFFKWLAGIQPRPEAVGFDRIAIQPQPAAGLTWVKAWVRTVRGEVRSEWRLENGRFELHVVVPANTRSTVFVPADDPASVREGARPAAEAEGVASVRLEPGEAVLEIGSGDYVFLSELGSKTSDPRKGGDHGGDQ